MKAPRISAALAALGLALTVTVTAAPASAQVPVLPSRTVTVTGPLPDGASVALTSLIRKNNNTGQFSGRVFAHGTGQSNPSVTLRAYRCVGIFLNTTKCPKWIKIDVKNVDAAYSTDRRELYFDGEFSVFFGAFPYRVVVVPAIMLKQPFGPAAKIIGKAVERKAVLRGTDVSPILRQF